MNYNQRGEAQIQSIWLWILSIKVVSDFHCSASRDSYTAIIEEESVTTIAHINWLLAKCMYVVHRWWHDCAYYTYWSRELFLKCVGCEIYILYKTMIIQSIFANKYIILVMSSTCLLGWHMHRLGLCCYIATSYL